MKVLTKRQQQVLDFIVARIEQDGYPPTIREIGEHMSIRSTNGVNDHLRALEKKGFLTRDGKRSRAMRPMSDEPVRPSRTRRSTPSAGLGNGAGGAATVPLLGHIAAGLPITAFEQAEEQVLIDKSLLGREVDDIFALRVRGESMIEDGIFDGDLIFVRRQHTASRGEIVVALIDDEATVKRYYPFADEIHFEPANATMSPIIVRRSDFKDTQLLGVVVGVYRQVA